MAPRQLPNRSTVGHYWHETGFTGVIARACLRVLQFIFAIVIAGIYGADLKRASNQHKSAQTEWVYAEVAAGLTILTCIIHCFVTIKRVFWVFWDFILCVLWAAQFGVFASIYLQMPTDAESRETYYATASVSRMKATVWVDLINMLLWFTTFVQGITWCCVARRITRKTGRMARLDLDGERGNESSKGKHHDVEDEQTSFRPARQSEESHSTISAPPPYDDRD
ncbi:hypothetical protein KC343_g3584 [Hortaea werneckii]|uniref:MARVEL domain-containing protein n=1 Tax=Hortaea werneckii TaxID=91943 RepID=A0A3M7G7V3_HORWE|nr:hypothetical protein KC352_g5349 [Hortaea werneckii]KAI7568657.1 hypothetical protein KC317_g3997 [Hortaea werneckii]KAI7627018.1 hypothetical protein KC346_g956 [Hortaea werneckii]KAI7632266.1 hypothetical protein KC343_g3584 [Hortaea werneckii]KAI7668127.1 hypothetical protein KC319_g6494 [Hortaea werneckii]